VFDSLREPMSFSARFRLSDRGEERSNLMDVKGTAPAETAAAAADEAAFGALAERYRPELQVHCYRMTGSLEDAEDLVQETLLRAWRRRRTFAGRSTFRAWLYGIATNACLDEVARRRRRARARPGEGIPAEVPWLQPYPDLLLAAAAPSEDEPDRALVSKETIELAFLVAIQHLPPNQRAVLIVRDVLGWSAKEAAALLGTSVAAVNSALQRARATMRARLPERRAEWAPGAEPSEAERALLARYMAATERDDPEGLAATLSEDARFTMPPEPGVWVGRETVVASWVEGGFGTDAFGHIRCLATRANMQPAVANYLRKPGEPDHRPMALDVLRIAGGLVADIVTFPLDAARFGLPAFLPEGKDFAGRRPRTRRAEAHRQGDPP
jgi:RNA polymerase sigma-70 factor (ECF subfamily)